MNEDRKFEDGRSAADGVVLSIAIAAWLLAAFVSLDYLAFFGELQPVHLPLAVGSVLIYGALCAFRKRRIMRSIAYTYLGLLYLLPAVVAIYLKYVRYW